MTLERVDLPLLLEASGALRQGHFVLSSGLHSASYVQCALLLEQPARARRVGMALAAELAELKPDSVVSPALGGVVIGHEVATALEVPFRFTERVAGEMTLKRGFCLAPGERVVVVEDVVTTGGSTLEAASVVEQVGGGVVAVASIIDRTGGRSPFAVPFVSLLALEFTTWKPETCPLCAQGRDVLKPGSRDNSAGR